MDTSIITLSQIFFFKRKFQADVCKTAAEFLLEPWILLQIPFQPVLLNQWTVALLAEALIFQKKISPIFSYGFPRQLNNVAEHLRNMLKSMMNCVNFTLKVYLKIIYTDGQENKFYSTLAENKEEFSNHLTTVLPILGFVTSEEATSVIEAIIKICLERLNRGDEVNPPQVVIVTSEEQRMPLYDFWSWTLESNQLDVLTGSMSGQGGKCNTELLRGDKVNIIRSESPKWLVVLKMLIVYNNIIKTGRLKGVDREIILAVMDKHADDLYIYCTHYQQYMSMLFYTR